MPKMELVSTDVGPADHPWAWEFRVDDQYAGYSAIRGGSVSCGIKSRVGWGAYEYCHQF